MTSVVFVFSSMSGVERTIAYLGRLNGGAYDGILGVLLSTRGGCGGRGLEIRPWEHYDGRRRDKD